MSVHLLGIAVYFALGYASNVSIGIQPVNSARAMADPGSTAWQSSNSVSERTQGMRVAVVHRPLSPIRATVRELCLVAPKTRIESDYSYWDHWRGTCSAMHGDTTANATSEGSLSPEKPRSAARLAVRLRTMIAAILAIGIWTAWQVNRARSVWRFVRMVERAEGTVQFNRPFDDSGQWKSSIHPPMWLYRTLGDEYFSEVVEVTLYPNKGESTAREAMRGLQMFPHLKRLTLEDICVSDSDLEAISKLRDLEEISIGEPAEVMGDQLDRDAARTHESGSVPRLTPAGLRHLGEMRKLRSIHLLTRNVVDASVVEAWSVLPQLRDVTLLPTPSDEAGIRALGKLTHLKTLSIYGNYNSPFLSPTDPAKRSKRTALPIASWTGLELLSVGNWDLSSTEISAIGRLPKLVLLSLQGCSVSDADLLKIQDLQTLRNLLLSKGSCTQEAIGDLKKALPRLRIREL